MPTDLPTVTARQFRLAGDRQERAWQAVLLALLSIPAASPFPSASLSGVSGGGGEAGGSDYPAREFSSFDSPAGRVAGRVKGKPEIIIA